MINQIVFTGSTGSIGSCMPISKNIIPLKIKINESRDKISRDMKKNASGTFLHLAAMTDKKSCEKYKNLCTKINIKAAIKLYKIASEMKFDRFIFVSTSDIYKPKKKLQLIDVNDRLLPDSFYSLSKLIAEKELIKLSQKNNFIPLSIARVFNVSSQKIRKDSLEERVHNLAKIKKFEYIEGLNKVRDISSSKQVCKELIKLSKSKKFPLIVNICSGKPTDLFTFVSTIYKKYNLNFKLNYKFSIPKKNNFIVGKKTSY